MAEHVITITGCTVDFTAGGKCPLTESEQDQIRDEFAADIRRATTMQEVLAAVNGAEDASTAQEGRYSRYGGAGATVLADTEDETEMIAALLSWPRPEGTPDPGNVPVRIAEPLMVVR